MFLRYVIVFSVFAMPTHCMAETLSPDAVRNFVGGRLFTFKCPTRSGSWSFCVSLPTIAELTVKMIEFDVLSMVESGSGLKQRYRDLADSYRRVIRERSLGLRDGLDQEA
jgi:hypothetical protein